ncbi:MAG: carbohydrate-binding cenc domain protein, partial [Paenibacillaceae bacterium]|nr:carbohydrate-binding cenc domain protein [Paenibacillaceae bacterium]
MKNRSKSYGIVLLAGVLCLLGLMLADRSAEAAGNTYYVATTGNDTTGNGTIGNPWRTIQKAASLMAAGDTCIIRAGTYRETVTPANSGTAGNPITFKAYTGETVTINGTDPVTSGWTAYSGSIYRTSINMPMGEYNQVFVDNSMQLWAQWPNDSDGDPFTLEIKRADSGSDPSHLVDADLTQADDYWNGAKLYFAGGSQWFWQSATVTDFEAATDKLTFAGDAPYLSGASYLDLGGNNPYYLAGKLSLLDTAKEWYYDSANQYLYLWIGGGGSPASHTVEVKKRNLAFDLQGKSYIAIQDVSLFAAAINGQGASHTTVKHITAKYLNHSSNINLGDDAFISNSKGLGINFIGDDNEIRDSDLEYSGFSSIYTRGKNNRIVNNYVKKSTYHGWRGGG